MKATIVSIAAALCFSSTNSHAQGGHGRGPSMALEFENQALTVLRVRLAPREKTPMHDLTARVVVWLTDAHLKDTAADGKTREEHWKAGQAIWVPAQRHAGENLGDRPIEFIAIVPKPAR